MSMSNEALRKGDPDDPADGVGGLPGDAGSVVNNAGAEPDSLANVLAEVLAEDGANVVINTGK